MKARILRRGGDRIAQHHQTRVLASHCAIKIRQIDGCRSKVRVEALRCLVLGFGFGSPAPLHEEITKRYASLRTIGIEPLRGDELRRGSIESASVGIGLAGRWNWRKQRYCPNADSFDRIREQGRSDRPELIGGNATQHLERRHPHHRIAVRKPILRQIEVGSRKIWAELGEGARANDGGYIAVQGDLAEKLSGIRLLRPRGMKSSCVVLESLPLRSEPALNRTRRPLGRFVAVTIVASVWRAELHRQIGTGNPKTMIVPPIHHHVGALGHVTGGTGDRNIHTFVVAMRRGLIFAWRMALTANAIS